MFFDWITNEPKNIKLCSSFWNMVGGLFMACQAAIILVFISHKLGNYVAGLVTIAYAVDNLLYVIAKYGIRNFQVSDVNFKYSLSDYTLNRAISIVLTFVILFGYVGYSLLFTSANADKIIIVAEVFLLKMVDAAEDVFLGYMQQKGRLDSAAKIMSLRLIFSTSFICIAVLVGLNIYISIAVGIIFSILIDFMILPKVMRNFTNGDKIFSFKLKKSTLRLFVECLSLCIGTALSIYIGNVPKYMIDAYLDVSTQAVFGYIMMPVFVITLLNQFLYQPLIKDLADTWESKGYEKFNKMVLRQCIIVLCLTVVTIIAGVLVGLPLLAVLYNTDLSAYRNEFIVLLFGGGFYALAYYLNVPLTVIRKQASIAVGYIIASVFSVIAGAMLVRSHGMMGASVLYLIINVLLCIIYSVVLIFGERTIRRKGL